VGSIVYQHRLPAVFNDPRFCEIICIRIVLEGPNHSRQRSFSGCSLNGFIANTRTFELPKRLTIYYSDEKPRAELHC
jgi:hypothetical protein